MKRFSPKLREKVIAFILSKKNFVISLNRLFLKIKAEFQYFSPLIEEIIPWRFNTNIASHNFFVSPSANICKPWRTLSHDSDFEILVGCFFLSPLAVYYLRRNP
jgi:hypothetical protein